MLRLCFTRRKLCLHFCRWQALPQLSSTSCPQTDVAVTKWDESLVNRKGQRHKGTVWWRFDLLRYSEWIKVPTSCERSDRLTNWQTEKSQNDKLTKWQIDKLTKSQNDKITKWQSHKVIKRGPATRCGNAAIDEVVQLSRFSPDQVVKLFKIVITVEDVPCSGLWHRVAWRSSAKLYGVTTVPAVNAAPCKAHVLLPRRWT
jgi:hypothetical protein